MMMLRLDLSTARARRGTARFDLCWLLLALALCACREDPSDVDSDTGPSTPPDAAVSHVDGSRVDPVTTGAAEAGTTDATVGASASPEGGSAPDAGALDAGVDAADAAAQALDAQVRDATADASDAADANAVGDAREASEAGDATPSIYDDDTKWMCRPGLPNSLCQQTLQITDLHADGGTSVSELPKTPADVAADCLYLYPTIDPGLFAAPRNLDFPQIDRASVRDIFFGQGLPFRGTCALYAPFYRQTSLTSFEDEATREKGLETGYRDLEAAFDYYLRHAAAGRPLVLIAHSQGAIITTRLLQRRFEGHPELLSRLVVAVLAGPQGGFVVPKGGALGGSLKEIPLCTSAEQTGCVLTYNSYSANAPPSADYTKVNGYVKAGSDPGCTTPPGGSAGSAARLSGALFPLETTAGGLLGLLALKFDFGAVQVRTPYARYADFYSARCAESSEGLSYLRIAAEPLAGDVRKDPVPYDHVAISDPAVGLHALDYTFVSADLVQAVQTKLNAHHK
jgi:hypothetical protein